MTHTIRLFTLFFLVTALSGGIGWAQDEGLGRSPALATEFATQTRGERDGGVAGGTPAEGVGSSQQLLRTTEFSNENSQVEESNSKNTSEPRSGGETSPSLGITTETSPSQNIIQLPEIVTYIDAPVVEQRQSFSAEDIERMGVADLPSLVEQSGVQLLSYGTYGLEQKPSIRGFTDETVRVVVDGICMNNAQTGTFDFSTIDMASVEKVEIVRGGFTEGVEDEGAVGGVIYITTKKQDVERHLTLDSSIKSFGNMTTSPLTLDTFSQKISFDSPVGENSFLKVHAAGTFAQNRFLFENYYGRVQTQKHAKVVDGSAGADWTLYFGNGNYVSIADTVYAGDKRTPNTITSVDWGRQKDVNNTLTATLYNPAVADLFNLKSTAAFLRSHRTYKATNEDSRHDIYDGKLSSQADFFTWKRVKQSAGLSFDMTYLDSTNSGVHTQVSGVLKSTTKLFLTEWFSATVPMAFKFCGKNAAFTPKLGFAAKFEQVEFLIDGYRMTQFPNMDDLYWEGSGYHGNPDLRPEKGWGADFTVNAKEGLGSGLLPEWILFPFSVQLFTNYYEDKIAWASGTTENFKSAFYFGVDFNAQKVLFDGRLTLSATGEYLYTKLLNKDEPLTYGKKIMWTPDWTASASATLNFSVWDATLSANYTGKRYKTNLNLAYLEPYTLMHLSANLKVWEKVRPYVKIENLLNTSYESIEDYAMPGLSVTVGARVKL